MIEFAKQAKAIGNELNLEIDDASNFLGQINTGFYYWNQNWKYSSIGFEFGANAYGDFFYGICRKNIDLEIPENLKNKIKERLINKDGQSEIWPWWKWFETKNWDIQIFDDINNSMLKNKIKAIVEDLIRKLDGLEL